MIYVVLVGALLAGGIIGYLFAMWGIQHLIEDGYRPNEKGEWNRE